MKDKIIQYFNNTNYKTGNVNRFYMHVKNGYGTGQNIQWCRRQEEEEEEKS